MKKIENTGQIIWGAALLIMGIAIFFRIPQIMPKIEEIEIFKSMSFFIRGCFYLIGIILIGGGMQKLYKNLK